MLPTVSNPVVFCVALGLLANRHNLFIVLLLSLLAAHRL